MLKVLDHLEEWLISFLMGAATLIIFAAVMHRYADNAEKLGAELGKVHTATEEINVLMKWPDEQLKKGEPKEELPVSMHRGGR